MTCIYISHYTYIHNFCMLQAVLYYLLLDYIGENDGQMDVRDCLWLSLRMFPWNNEYYCCNTRLGDRSLTIVYELKTGLIYIKCMVFQPTLIFWECFLLIKSPVKESFPLINIKNRSLMLTSKTGLFSVLYLVFCRIRHFSNPIK